MSPTEFAYDPARVFYERFFFPSLLQKIRIFLRNVTFFMETRTNRPFWWCIRMCFWCRMICYLNRAETSANIRISGVVRKRKRILVLSERDPEFSGNLLRSDIDTWWIYIYTLEYWEGIFLRAKIQISKIGSNFFLFFLDVFMRFTNTSSGLVVMAEIRLRLDAWIQAGTICCASKTKRFILFCFPFINEHTNY